MFSRKKVLILSLTVLVVALGVLTSRHKQTTKEDMLPSFKTNSAQMGAQSTSTRKAVEPIHESITETTLESVFPHQVFTNTWLHDFPATITVAIGTNEPVTFDLVSATGDNSYTTWTAKCNTIPGALLVGTTANGGIDFLQSIPGRNEVSISVRGSKVVVWEKDSTFTTCGAERRAQLLSTAQTTGDSVNPVALTAAANAVYTGDVLLVYTAEALARAVTTSADNDGAAFILSTARNQVQSTNIALSSSLITNFVWRVAGVAQCPAYTRDGTMATDINYLTNTSTVLGKWALDKATEFGADSVALWVYGKTEYAGIANMPGHYCVVYWGTDFKTLAHELGHNLGCDHDRVTAKASDGDGHFNYGYRFSLPSPASGSGYADVGDIMSYATLTYPFFSNPNLSVDISPYYSSQLHIPGGLRVLGVGDDQPQAADCARTITEAAQSMSSYRATVLNDLPSITAQPVSSTVTEGNKLTLTVTATGGGLNYQWRQNGNVIPGATSSSYTVNTAATTNAGTYDCVISNILGSITTNTITVTVNQTSGRTLPTPPAGGKIINISCRAMVGTGGDILIGGVVIAGGKAQILVRAIGPTLSTYGVPETLSDPKLVATRLDGTVLTQNLNWNDSTAGASGDQLSALFNKLGAFSLSAGSKDACLLITLDSGCYTFMVSGQNGETGVALLESYIVTDSGLPGYLLNLSARAWSGKDGKQMIGGAVARGDTGVLVRAVGPKLADLGVTGVLPKPVLNVFSADRVKLDSVSKWSTTYSYSEASSLFAKLGAFALPFGSDDSIVALNLPSNDTIRTFMVEDSNGSTGVALLEVYLVTP